MSIIRKQKRPPLPDNVKKILIYRILATLQENEEPISANKIAERFEKIPGFEEFERVVREPDVEKIAETMVGVEVAEVPEDKRVKHLYKLTPHMKSDYSSDIKVHQKIESELMKAYYKKREKGE